MSVNPCSVCGGTDLNLVDGFYYCVECGTQDVNVQETVVEHTMLADGTFAHAASRKLTILKDGIKMSGEWHKWHAYNFILSALADELIALGARPSVKMKVLWVWTRYIKEFQVKEDMDQTKELFNHEDSEVKNIEEKETINNEDVENKGDEEDFEQNDEKAQKSIKTKDCNNFTKITKNLLLTILYVALNLDRSDILLSHLNLYIREERLSVFDCIKYVPKELNKKSIPDWNSFLRATLNYFAPNSIRELAMTCFKRLDLGTPLVPDMRKVIDNFVTELCLPKEFKNLVFSLMNLVPCDFLEGDIKSKKTLRIPDFEAFGMAYVLIALKMCFGLDDDYEIRLSDAVDKINEEENLTKSYKLGFTEPSDRLFSFREWCNYLQFRKIMLCKFNLPMSRQHNLEVDDHVFMEQLGEKLKRKIELSDQLAMDMLDKIPLEENVGVIPKSEFFPTLTPMTSYTEVIVKYVQNPEFSLLLSEDFSQYSLKYACEDLKLPTKAENIITGVTEDNKTINPVVTGMLVAKQSDFTMVYVRNCENKNWLKTKPPTVDHITKINENEGSDADKDSDHGYDSNIENTPIENSLNNRDKNNSNDDTENTKDNSLDEAEIERKLEVIDEEEAGKSIFDDAFEDLHKDVKQEIPEPEDKESERSLVNRFEYEDDYQDNFLDSKDFTNNENVFQVDENELGSLSPEHQFNEETFDREKTIKELILTACQQYKIPVPREYNPSESRKRKTDLIHDEAGSSEPKRKRTRKKRGELKQEIDKIINSYYRHLENDIINNISEQVKSVVHNFDKTDDELDETLNNIDGDQSYVNFDDTLIGQNNSEAEPRLITDQNDENAPQTSIFEKTLDASVFETNNDDDCLENLVSKDDPNFDEKTHHIKQLYIKFKEDINTEDMFELDDPELLKILDEKIEEFSKRKPELCAADSTIASKDEKKALKSSKIEVNDSEDDIPLIVFQQEKKLKRDRKRQRKEKLEPLIKNSDNLSEFKYWFRHYSARRMYRCLDIQQKFDLELKENCPSSFNFVINECAAILNCTAFSLYKCMQNLEKILIDTVR